MLTWFNAKERNLWIITFLIPFFIMGAAMADSSNFSLTTYAGSPVIIRAGQVVSAPIYIGDTVQVPISGSLTCSSNPGQECTIDSVSYSFPSATISYSPDGNTFTSGGGSVSITNVDSAHGTATLNATFQNAGYYKITFAVHADYTSSSCGNGSKDASGNLTYAVQAGDFDFSLSPSSVIVPNGGNATTNAWITSYHGFTGTINFGRADASTYLPGWNISGSGRADANLAQPEGPYPLTITTASVPFSLTGTSYPLGIRGTAQVGSILLTHDHPITVNVNFLYITGPYDNSNSKAGPNKRTATGSITTDTVLSLQTQPVVSDPWRATSALATKNTANLSGLSYNWSADYGNLSYGQLSSDQASYQVNQSDPITPSNPNALFRTTTVTATNIGSASQPSFGSNTYTIRWHHQFENWQKDTTKTPVPFLKVLQYSSVRTLPLVGCGTGGIWTEPHFPYQQRESTFAGIDQFVKFASNSVGGK